MRHIVTIPLVGDIEFVRVMYLVTEDNTTAILILDSETIVSIREMSAGYLMMTEVIIGITEDIEITPEMTGEIKLRLVRNGITT